MGILKEIQKICLESPRKGFFDVTFYGDMSNHYSFGYYAELYSSKGIIGTKDFNLHKDHPVLQAFIALREGLAKEGDINSGFSQVRLSYENGEAKFQYNYDEPSPLWFLKKV